MFDGLYSILLLSHPFITIILNDGVLKHSTDFRISYGPQLGKGSPVSFMCTLAFCAPYNFRR